MWRTSVVMIMALALASSVSAQQKEETPTMEMDGSAVRSDDGPSLDRLNNFPEDFNGKVVHVSPVWLDGDLTKSDSGRFYLRVRDERTGKRISTSTYDNGILFVLSRPMAKSLQDHIKAELEHGVALTCQVYSARLNGKTLWFATVTDVDFLTIGGNIAFSVEGPPEIVPSEQPKTASATDEP